MSQSPHVNPDTALTVVSLNAWVDRADRLNMTNPGQAFARLHAYLKTPAGLESPVIWSVEGRTQKNPLSQFDVSIESHERYLAIKASTTAHGTCSRCLQPVAIDLAVDTVLRIYQNDADADEAAMREEADLLPDPIVASAQFDLLAQVEEELLLEFPDNPMHPADLASCVLPESGQAEPLSPFAAALARISVKN